MGDFTFIGAIMAFVFGTCIGSFLNVLIWRLPREESINGRSRCPNCKHNLIWIDLVPVLSIVLFQAKCRYCKARISLRYPLMEVLTGVLFSISWLLVNPTDFITWVVLLKALVVISICIVVFVVDLEHYLILDKVVLPAAFVMAIFSLVLHTYGNLLAGAIGFVVFWLIWFISRGKWMGFGDAKFVLFMGLVLDLSGLGVALFLAFGIGATVGVLLIILGKKDLGSKLPFGTFLSITTIISMFYGPKLLDFYLSLL